MKPTRARRRVATEVSHPPEAMVQAAREWLIARRIPTSGVCLSLAHAMTLQYRAGLLDAIEDLCECPLPPYVHCAAAKLHARLAALDRQK